jgi:hypothetical protein
MEQILLTGDRGRETRNRGRETRNKDVRQGTEDWSMEQRLKTWKRGRGKGTEM